MEGQRSEVQDDEFLLFKKKTITNKSFNVMELKNHLNPMEFLQKFKRSEIIILSLSGQQQKTKKKNDWIKLLFFFHD